MRISRPRSEDRDGRRRVCAEVRWEDSERPDHLLYYEVEERHAADLEAAPEAFVLACVPPALWMGERRLSIDAPLCAELGRGVEAMSRLLRLWYERVGPLRLEADGGFAVARPAPGAATASFMSGGVDALALLRGNRLDYPLDHPGSIRTCLLLFGTDGFDVDERGPVPERLEAFERHRRRLETLARAERFELVTIYTNVRSLVPDFEAWMKAGFGAMNASAAHALRPRVRTALLASDGGGMGAIPAGSHPLLDPLFSSAAVAIRPGQPALDRIEKIRLVADWGAALAIARPCHQMEVLPEDRINCGACEKCVRTKLSLLVIGRLDGPTSFAERDVRPEEIEALRIPALHKLRFLEDHVPGLREIGRHDLADAIGRKAAAFHRRQRRRERRRHWRRLRSRLGGGDPGDPRPGAGAGT